MKKSVLVDLLKKQEGRDARGWFEKGSSGNPEGRFRKGQSGNPAGRPPGVRNKATETAELLLDGDAEALTRKALELELELELALANARPDWPRTHRWECDGGKSAAAPPASCAPPDACGYGCRPRGCTLLTKH
jgi:hypothetical protein